MKWLAAVLIAVAEAAIAANNVSIKAISHDGTRAVVAYDSKWVEVGLTPAGGARSIQQPWGCQWTAAAYTDEGADLAMTLFCPGPDKACDLATTELWRRTIDEQPEVLAEATGERWSSLTWREGRGDALLIATPLYPPLAQSLDDLSRNRQNCEWGRSRMTSFDMQSGRRIGFDILPPIWTPTDLIAADGRRIAAVVRATTGADDGSAAAEEIDAFCADGAPASPNAAVCAPAGARVAMTWDAGEWRLIKALDDETPGRIISTLDGRVTLKESCRIVHNGARASATCEAEVLREGETSLHLIAPTGLFGDFALSGDGSVLVSVDARPGRRDRRFVIYDLVNGEARDAPELLSLRPPFDQRPLQQ